MTMVTAEMTPPRMVVGASFGMLMRKSTKGLSPFFGMSLATNQKQMTWAVFWGTTNFYPC